MENRKLGLLCLQAEDSAKCAVENRYQLLPGDPRLVTWALSDSSLVCWTSGDDGRREEAAGMTGLLGRRGAELALFVDLKRKAHVGGTQRRQGSGNSLNKN